MDIVVEIIKVDAEDWHMAEICPVGNASKKNERRKIQKGWSTSP